MNDIEAAYIAGLIDGEGCIRIWKAPNKISPAGFQYRTCVEITMCDTDTMAYVSEVTGRRMSARTIPSGRVAYKCIWYNHNAADLLRAIIPYLKGKKEQARLSLVFEDEVAPGKGRKMTADLMVKAEDLVRQVSNLKRPHRSSLLISQS